jgi:hypothetical protein
VDFVLGIKRCYIYCIVIVIETMKLMKRFVEGESRLQSTLFHDQLDDYIAEDNSARVIDVFVDIWTCAR